MSPLGIGSSDSTYIFTTGEAKLWILLVGINEYQDVSLPNLRYPAGDCEALGDALAKVTQRFLRKEVIIHHDFMEDTPTLKTVCRSLERIVSKAKPTDSIFLYFSGHGMLEPDTQDVVLCLSDTRQENLPDTGLPVQKLLQILETSRTNQQLVCLDTCHSGDMKMPQINNASFRELNITETLLNPATNLVNALRKRASRSKGFCALLSCDQGQQSWEFPELGHGAFTYYLVRGLLGEAADSHGVIEADGLYKYVYRQTLQYIDKLNHQLRLINKQKLNRGDRKLYPEYPLQTPKRIVEGVGEFILGFKYDADESHQQRRALVIDGLSNKINTDLIDIFAHAGDFQAECWHQQSKSWSDIEIRIKGFLDRDSKSTIKSPPYLELIKPTPTCLLYLRGYIEENENGEAWFILGNGVLLSRSYLKQQLQRATKTQQIIILDCPNTNSLKKWIEYCQCGTEYGQCIIAATSTIDKSELFCQTLHNILASVNVQVGLSVSKLIAELQKRLPKQDVRLDFWISETQTIIDILPSKNYPNFSQRPYLQRNQQEQQKKFPSHHLDDVTEIPSTTLPLPSPIPVTSEAIETVKPQLNLLLSSEQLTELENLLKQSLGIVAPIVLKKALKVNNGTELIRTLANYLPHKEQEKFKEQALFILNKKSSFSLSRSANEQTINAAFLGKCERELTNLIGSDARLNIQHILESHTQITSKELVDKLIAKIPDPQLALKFKQRIWG
ncbi:Peptidase C14, caspase catalytic subunit p20 [Trichormus variabilis ATCC 29413]|uniref:Peptidase C14, caspase catalytic subunit p20 n=4 Tax=Anabaena variabilis TaxID=264691 RepID=Q3M5M6_TRIV2|nr:MULTISPECIES: caspase family protein [Nostocaceae]ABA23710.1 Peptidase C14, caspase catalytic subunit p20 [Trichormus variabilis ATCC 29413]MBC1254862.1 caspase family protein [Trichormus variabilis V5]MBC1270318.1 caspase family protein [Trichormus variabilis FSR]MBC1310301.1 caspase family protein [Trichormus variabilis PNB]MBC1325293.1 caspase family protein [Trichormus variabilis 9RC]